MKIDTGYFKRKLEEERKTLEQKLVYIEKRKPVTLNNQEEGLNLNVMPSDQSEVADTFEEMENLAALKRTLENRLEKVNKALKKIKEGKFGICEIGGCPIERERLEANPAAETCLKHFRNS